MSGDLTHIGATELVSFPKLDLLAIPARIDSGAKTSTVWASDIREEKGVLKFTLFDTSSEHYSNKAVETRSFSRRVVTSSNGQAEERYVVKLAVTLAGRKIRASFTLANRSLQAYPVLVGRNILRGKFLIDVRSGHPITKVEMQRGIDLKSLPQNKGQEQV